MNRPVNDTHFGVRKGLRAASLLAGFALATVATQSGLASASKDFSLGALPLYFEASPAMNNGDFAFVARGYRGLAPAVDTPAASTPPGAP